MSTMEAETPGPGVQDPVSPGDEAASAAAAAAATVDPGGVPHDSAAIQEVLEYLLSKKNLVKDQLLASSMNPQMYIPVGVLAGHEMLKSVDASEEDIIAAAQRSAKLSADEDGKMVRPLLRSKRNVILIRDVPNDTTEDDIRQIFAGVSCGERIVSIKEEVNNTWFVKFDLDSNGTQEVVLWLRSQDFKGKPVNAAIKSEHFLRSFFPASGYPAQGQPMDYGMAEPPAAAYDGAGFAPPGFGGPTDMNLGGCGDAMVGGACDGSGGGLMPPGYESLMPPGMAKGGMPPLWIQASGQEPGFWQPWGKRLQPPALIFSSPTTLASGQAPPPRPEPSNEWLPPGKGKGRGKGKDKDFSMDKGWKGKAKGGGKSTSSAPAWYAIPVDQPSKGKGRGGGGDPTGGRRPPTRGYRQAPEEGSHPAPVTMVWQPKSTTSAGTGESSTGGSASAAATAAASKAPPGKATPAPSPVYEQSFKKYSSDELLQIREAVRQEDLVMPQSFEAVSGEAPVFRTAPALPSSTAESQ